MPAAFRRKSHARVDSAGFSPRAIRERFPVVPYQSREVDRALARALFANTSSASSPRRVGVLVTSDGPAGERSARMDVQAPERGEPVEQVRDHIVQQRHAKIEKLAYFLWCCGGRRNGYADDDWCIAEHLFDTASFRTGQSDHLRPEVRKSQNQSRGKLNTSPAMNNGSTRPYLIGTRDPSRAPRVRDLGS